MKKVLTITAFAIAMCGAINSGNAQNWGAGVGLSFLKFGNAESDTKMHFGPGLRGRWDNDDRIAVSFGFNFYLPNSYKTDVVVSPNSTYAGTLPNGTGTFDEKFSALHIFAHGNYYLVGESKSEDFGLYGIFGLGYLSESVKADFSTSVDQTKYDVSSYTTTSESANGITFDLGVGADFPVTDNLMVFGEAQLNLPANQANGEAIEVKINSSYCFNLGVRMPFGK